MYTILKLFTIYYIPIVYVEICKPEEVITWFFIEKIILSSDKYDDKV